ncbi:uncharacterized protein DNG_09652 [Cephalotrichum gorgonifer]|uniref:Increased recombination centers protein 6 n=1 Tax=Cephalotrichum gorgonifer TaxID=2041049 RepID=A0AAE8SZM4_9PEZI|nr:uncharacterized protein DNG_09652 [Cephalotrichum gorgonifer]
MSGTKVPEVENPRRILAVSLESSSEHLARVVKDLSGTAPTPSPTLSGVTHILPLSTPYYTASLPVWLDLIEDPEDWSSTFLSPEAKEVLDVLGGLIVVFEIPTTGSPDAAEALIREVGRVVREGLGGWEWDGVVVAVGLGSDESGDWEDRCAGGGMELVVVSGGEAEGARNEFGEKVGIARVMEALQANDWTGVPDEEEEPDLYPDSDSDFGLGDPGDFEGLRQAILEASLEREGWGAAGDEDEKEEGGPGEGGSTKTAEGRGAGSRQDRDEKGEEDIGDEDVRKMEAMMSKLLAARELGEGMPEGERRRMARRAVGEVMKEL